MKRGVLVCVAIMFESVADSPSPSPSRVSSPVLCLSLMKVGSLDHDGERERGSAQWSTEAAQVMAASTERASEGESDENGSEKAAAA